MTGFTAKTRALILERDGGCAWCGRSDGDFQIHHRSPRGMGGAKNAWVNAPSNGVTLCEDHHAHVEKHRTRAEQLGFIVRRGIKLPAHIPIAHATWGTCFLTDSGGITYTPPE